MADKEIGDLTAAGRLDGTELVHIVQSANSRKATVDELHTWRASKGHLHGLVLSNSSTDSDTAHDIGIAIGEAASDDASSPVLMELSTAIYKKMDATFAEGTGNGGMVSGESLPTSGTVHIWLIMKADGTVDVCANNHATSGLSPTLPTDFVYKRRIGSLRTDASNNFLLFFQDGDEFTPNTAIVSINGVSIGSTAELRAIGSPLGLKLIAVLRGYVDGGTFQYRISDPQITDVAQNNFNASGVSSGQMGEIFVRTDTSGRVSVRAASSTNFSIGLVKWIDTRGRIA